MTTDRFIIEQGQTPEDPTGERDDYLEVVDRLGKLAPAQFYFHHDFDLIRELVRLANVGHVQSTRYIIQD